MKKVAVVLSGCGVFDGSEIHESVLCLLALSMSHAEAHCFAPDIQQHHVTNHLSLEESLETRSVLVESGRIARGKIAPLSTFDARAFEALLFPGGMGAVTTLCDFADKNIDATVQPDVARAIREMIALKKPIGATCIAPIFIALTLQGFAQAKLTLGQNPSDLKTLQKLGMIPISCSADRFVFDETCKIYTTPAYMEIAPLEQIWLGVHSMVKALVGDA